MNKREMIEQLLSGQDVTIEHHGETYLIEGIKNVPDYVPHFWARDTAEDAVDIAFKKLGLVDDRKIIQFPSGSNSVMSEPNELTSLYVVYTQTTNFPHAEGYEVTIHWCIEPRDKPPVPYEKAIKNYSYPSYGETLIDELFTLEEAEALKTYLDSISETEITEIERIELPIPENLAGQTALGWGGTIKRIGLEDHNLPFSVFGYCELAGVLEEMSSSEDKERKEARKNDGLPF